MWEIFTHGKEPYPGLNKAQILDKVHTAKHRIILKFKKNELNFP